MRPRSRPCHNVDCPNLMARGEQCPDHPKWGTAIPTVDRSPTMRHRGLRAEFTETGRVCALAYEGCTRQAEELDRIDNDAGYDAWNLQGVCRSCHRRKTSAEAHRARGRKPGVNLPTPPAPESYGTIPRAIHTW